MIITAVVIPEDTRDDIFEIELNTADRYRINRLVGGSAHRLELSSGAVAFINCGSLADMDQPSTPLVQLRSLNPRAVALLGLAGNFEEVILVVGPVIICGPEDTNGRLTSIPPLLHSLLFDHEEYRVEYQEANLSNWCAGIKVYADPFGAALDAMALAKTLDVVAVRVVPA
ncbi:hypothetical protein ACWFRF_15630 [Nocardia sp. NPDC055165]